MQQTKCIKPLYFNEITSKSNVLEDNFITIGYDQLISYIGGFDDSESHPQLWIFFYYSPGNGPACYIMETRIKPSSFNTQKLQTLARRNLSLKAAMPSFYAFAYSRELNVCSVEHAP